MSVVILAAQWDRCSALSPCVRPTERHRQFGSCISLPLIHPPWPQPSASVERPRVRPRSIAPFLFSLPRAALEGLRPPPRPPLLSSAAPATAVSLFCISPSKLLDVKNFIISQLNNLYIRLRRPPCICLGICGRPTWQPCHQPAQHDGVRRGRRKEGSLGPAV